MQAPRSCGGANGGPDGGGSAGSEGSEGSESGGEGGGGGGIAMLPDVDEEEQEWCVRHGLIRRCAALRRLPAPAPAVTCAAPPPCLSWPTGFPSPAAPLTTLCSSLHAAAELADLLMAAVHQHRPSFLDSAYQRSDAPPRRPPAHACQLKPAPRQWGVDAAEGGGLACGVHCAGLPAWFNQEVGGLAQGVAACEGRGCAAACASPSRWARIQVRGRPLNNKSTHTRALPPARSATAWTSCCSPRTARPPAWRPAASGRRTRRPTPPMAACTPAAAMAATGARLRPWTAASCAASSCLPPAATRALPAGSAMTCRRRSAPTSSSAWRPRWVRAPVLLLRDLAGDAADAAAAGAAACLQPTSSPPPTTRPLPSAGALLGVAAGAVQRQRVGLPARRRPVGAAARRG